MRWMPRWQTSTTRIKTPWGSNQRRRVIKKPCVFFYALSLDTGNGCKGGRGKKVLFVLTIFAPEVILHAHGSKETVLGDLSMPTITDGNEKMGEVANISLPPVLSCNKSAPCAKCGCYAKALKRFPSCMKLWKYNWQQWHRRPDVYERQLDTYLQDNVPPLFRWHMAGDIPDASYWEMMLRLARYHWDINFLVFTKQYSLIKGKIPPNMSVVLSAWPGLPIPAALRRRFPVAWLRDHNQPDDRIPKNALNCHGNCEHCGLCWELKSIGRDVAFDRH